MAEQSISSAPRQMPTPSALVQAGYEALSMGDWPAARRAFEAALAEQETPEALEGLGRAAWWLDDAETLFRVREAAYLLFRRQEDHRAAARVAILLAEDYFTFRGELAVAQGWHQRAHDLLERLDLVPEHGWLKLSEGEFHLTVHSDPAAASAVAHQAMSIGRALAHDEIQMQARALEGAALVAEGRVTEGMQSLDGAVTAALSGEVANSIAIGYACCYMLKSCERARDYDRANQWYGRVKAFSEQIRCNILQAVCRTLYASMLIGRGQWGEAEQELQIAAEQLAQARPGRQVEALVRLVGLRRRQVRLAEVNELLPQVAGHPLALLEEATLALDRGEARTARQLAERFLRRVPAENRMDRLAGFEVILRAQLAMGELQPAALTNNELRVGLQEPGAVVATCHLAAGLLAFAQGEPETAQRELEDAVDHFTHCGAVFDAARSRLELAQVLRSIEQIEAARAEAGAALAILTEIGAAGEAARAAQLLNELTETGASAPPSVSGRLSRREQEVLRLVAQGLSNRQIATRLHVSEFTVKRHVQNILTKLDLPTRAAASAYAARHGLL